MITPWHVPSSWLVWMHCAGQDERPAGGCETMASRCFASLVTLMPLEVDGFMTQYIWFVKPWIALYSLYMLSTPLCWSTCAHVPLPNFYVHHQVGVESPPEMPSSLAEQRGRQRRFLKYQEVRSYHFTCTICVWSTMSTFILSNRSQMDIWKYGSELCACIYSST